MTNPVGQYPVGYTPVGGYYPSVAAKLYNVAATCYITAVSQIAKTADLTRVLFATINSQIGKMIRIIRTFFVIAITTQVLKYLQISRIVYVIAAAIFQKNINLSHSIYVVVYTLAAKILNLTRSAYLTVTQQIQKVLIKNPMIFYVTADGAIQRSLSLARTAYITAIVLLTIGKSYVLSFIAYVTITEQVNKSIIQAAKLCFISAKNLLQKTAIASQIAYITAVGQMNRAIAASRTSYVNVGEQLQKAVNWTWIAYITVLTNIQKQVNLFRFDYLLVVASAITGSTHQYFVTAIAYVVATMSIQKQTNIFRNVYAGVSIFIQKQMGLLRNSLLEGITSFSELPGTVLLIQKQINLSRLTIASAIIALLQKRIIQAGQTFLVGTALLLQRAVRGIRTFAPIIQISIQKQVYYSQTAYINLFALFLKTRTYLLTYTTYLSTAVSNQKQVEFFRNAYVNTLEAIQKRITILRNILVSIRFNKQNTIDQRHKTYVLAATSIQKQINLYRYIFGELNSFIQKQISFLTNILVTISALTQNQVGLFYETAATVGIQIQKRINLFRINFASITGLIQRFGYMVINIYSSITTQLQKHVQLSHLFSATIIALFARQRAYILSFIFVVTSNTLIQKYIYLARNAVVDGNLFVHKQLAFSRYILLNVFNSPFKQIELRRNAALSTIVTIPPKLIGIVRPFIIILTELAKKQPGIIRVGSPSLTSFVSRQTSLVINWQIKSTTSIQKTVIFLRMTYGIVAEIAVKQFQLPRKTFATIAASDIQKRVNLIKDFPISTTISMARSIRQAGQTVYLTTSVTAQKYISILKTSVLTATETILYGAGHLYFMTLTAMLGVTSSIKTFVKTRSPFRKAHIAPTNNVPGATGLGEKTAIIRGTVANNASIVTEKINKISHLNSLGSAINTIRPGITDIIDRLRIFPIPANRSIETKDLKTPLAVSGKNVNNTPFVSEQMYKSKGISGAADISIPSVEGTANNQ